MKLNKLFEVSLKTLKIMVSYISTLSKQNKMEEGKLGSRWRETYSFSPSFFFLFQ